MYDFVYITKWYNSLSKEQKISWDCDYCKKKKLHTARNCQNKYNTTQIVVSNNKSFKQCPLSLVNTKWSYIYSTIKLTLDVEMGGGFLPSQLIKEANLVFVYYNTIIQAEQDFDNYKIS